MNLLPQLALNVPAATLSALTALAYALVPWACPRLSPMQARALLAFTWGLHLLALLAGLVGDPVRFGFAPALSVTAWLVLTVYLIESRMYPQLKARWTLAVLGTLAVLLALFFPGSQYHALPSSWMPLHWALGIASYGLIAAAVVHAWLMQRADKAMRMPWPSSPIRRSPGTLVPSKTSRAVVEAVIPIFFSGAPNVMPSNRSGMWKADRPRFGSGDVRAKSNQKSACGPWLIHAFVPLTT